MFANIWLSYEPFSKTDAGRAVPTVVPVPREVPNRTTPAAEITNSQGPLGDLGKMIRTPVQVPQVR